MENPHISKIRIYPIKSLDPIQLTEVEVGIHSLKNDREFALVAGDGRYVNGKRTGRVNELKAKYDLNAGKVGLSHRSGGKVHWFELRAGNQALDTFLSGFFELPVSLVHNAEGQLMDIPKASSVTIVSEASLKSIKKDVNDVDMEYMRLRFRTNIELGGVSPFWEENLFGTPGIGRRFKLGNVKMIGVSPRARCNVPTRDPFTGEPNRSFAKKMMKSRAESLPRDSVLHHYGSMYHLTVNTFLPKTEKGKLLSIGDALELHEKVKLKI